MAETLTRMNYDEFSNNLAKVFELVIREKRVVEVEGSNGELAVLKPVVPIRLRRSKTKADHKAFLSAAGSWVDEDTDALLNNTYESRRLSSRPLVDL